MILLGYIAISLPITLPLCYLLCVYILERVSQTEKYIINQEYKKIKKLRRKQAIDDKLKAIKEIEDFI